MVKVCIFLADGFEEVEALTVVDLLRRAKIDITTVSITGKPEVTGRSRICISADALFENMCFGNMDMLILPGGMPGTTALGSFSPLCTLLKAHAAKGKYIAAICAAPSILGRLEILSGKKATSYPGFEQDMIGCEYLTQPTVCLLYTSFKETEPAFFLSIIFVYLQTLYNSEAIQAQQFRWGHSFVWR